MLRWVLAAVLTTSATSSLVADARMIRVQPSLALGGVWESTYGQVAITQTGNRIHGDYQCCGGGTLDGYVTGTVVRFHWREPRGAGEGEGVWRVQRDGSLQGSWGHGQSDTDGASWNMWRRRSSSQLAR